jgi:general secretion pathway protein K
MPSQVAILRLPQSRCGFALTTVLWVLTSAALLSFGVAASARSSLVASRNRILLARTAWIAEGCAERARAAVGQALATERTAARSWTMLDSVVASSPLVADCGVQLRPSGMTLSVNAASESELRSLFSELGISIAHSDTLVAALFDWIDVDDVARPTGAEKEWYQRMSRLPPRNGALQALRELGLVRGFERFQLASLDSVLGFEAGPILIDRAPIAVIATLPGVGPEFLASIAERRAAGTPVEDLAAFADRLPPDARTRMIAQYPSLLQKTIREPRAWILTSSSSGSDSAVRSALELYLVRSGPRAAIIRRRKSP